MTERGRTRTGDPDDAEADEAASTPTSDGTDADRPIEPGDPTFEGTVFVLLGMLVTAFTFSRLFIG